MTEDLHSSLAQTAGPPAASAVYRLTSRTSASTLARAAGAAGWQFFCADASGVRDKAAFLSVVGASLSFPEWAGHNWDAFEELVNDLSWLPAGTGCVLLLDRLGEFARRQPEELRVGLEILQAAAANRNAAGERPLLVLVRGGGRPAHPLEPLAVE